MKYRFEHYESNGELSEQVKEVVVQYPLNERLWVAYELLNLLLQNEIKPENTLIENGSIIMLINKYIGNYIALQLPNL